MKNTLPLSSATALSCGLILALLALCGCGPEQQPPADAKPQSAEAASATNSAARPATAATEAKDEKPPPAVTSFEPSEGRFCLRFPHLISSGKNMARQRSGSVSPHRANCRCCAYGFCARSPGRPKIHSCFSLGFLLTFTLSFRFFQMHIPPSALSLRSSHGMRNRCRRSQNCKYNRKRTCSLRHEKRICSRPCRRIFSFSA